MFKNTIAAFLVINTVLCASAFAGEIINETRETSKDPVIKLELINGFMSISAWDKEEFHIEGELSDIAEGFELHSSLGNIRFEENIERSRWNWRNFNSKNEEMAKLEVQVPRGSVLRFDGTNADIEVTGINGNTEIEVINGTIIASDLSGNITLKTVNGSIDSRNLKGRIDVRTVNGSIDDRDSSGSRIRYEAVNGSIRSNNSSGDVIAENVNGTIDLKLGSVDELEISTVSGRISVEAAMNKLAHIEMSSVGGRIELHLPKSTSSSFQINTAVGGQIRNRLTDDEASKTNRYTNAKDLNFVMNAGEGDVSISTVTGDIILRSKM